MSKSWTWIAPYYLGHLGCAPSRPLAEQLGLFQSVSVQNLLLSGSHAIQLVTDLLALAILWVLAFAASQHIPDNGSGSSFLHSLQGQNRVLELLADPLTGRGFLSIPSSSPQDYPNIHRLL